VAGNESRASGMDIDMAIDEPLAAGAAGDAFPEFND
jgi:hypothetical protein